MVWNLVVLCRNTCVAEPFVLSRARYDPLTPEGIKAGSFLAGGFRACLWALMGDLDYFASVFGLPRWNLAVGPCSLCRCNKAGEFAFTNFAENAPWVDTCWTVAKWFEWVNRSMHIIFSVPGVSVLSVMLDYMHLKYLGSDQYQFASVFALLVHRVMPGTPQENLDSCWAFIQDFYRQHGTNYRYQYLNKLTMFMRKNGYVKLRGKAGEIKDLGPALLALWEAKIKDLIPPEQLDIHRVIALMLKLNVKMEEILTEHKHLNALPKSEAKTFTAAAFGMAQCMHEAAEHYLTDDIKMFDITAKLHMIMHCALLAEHINPRLVWCFTGEDMMKQYSTLVGASAKGTPGTLVARKCIIKLRLAMHLQFQRMGEE